MDLNKKQTSVLIVYAVILIVYSILFLMIPFVRTPSSTIMFFFGSLSLILGYVITYIAFRGTDTLLSKVYGLPVFRIAYVYTGIQLAVSVIFFVINTFLFIIPAWAALLVGLVLLAFAITGAVAADNARDIVSASETKGAESLKNMERFKQEISSLAGACDNAEAKQLLEKLSEKLRYSDPVSNTALADIEARISSAVEELRGTADNAARIEKIKAVDRLLDERNRLCKAGK